MSDAQNQGPLVRIGAHAAALGHRLVTIASCASTNDLALEGARGGTIRQTTWFVAGAQTGGRGRRGRSWASPPGNLYASLLLIDPCAPERAPELGFVTGVALFRAIEPLLPDSVEFGLKWPNDLIADGAKLSGMLLEATRLPTGQSAVVIGIGVNCRSHPENLTRGDGRAYATTDLETLAPGAGGVSNLLAHLSDALADTLALWDRGVGFGAIRQAWLAAAVGLGGVMTVALGDKTVEGVFETIDPTGRLVLKSADGALAIDAGDVLLEPKTRK